MSDTLKDVYTIISSKVDFSEEEFMNLPNNEKNDWIEACKLAYVLYENKSSELYNGYRSSNIFDGDGNIDLAACAVLVKSKKKLYDVISDSANRPGTLVEFILLGEVGTAEIVKQVIQTECRETAKVIEEGKISING